MSGILVQRRYRMYLASCTILLFIAWSVLFTDESSIFRVILFDRKEAPPDFVWRVNAEEALELTPSVRYSRRCIKPVFTHQAKREDIGNISEPLILDQVNLQLNQSPESLIEPLAPCLSIRLTVPFPYTAGKQFPDLIFGMATLYSRMSDSLTHITHWASDGGCKLIVIISDWDDQSQEDISLLQQRYRDNNVQLSLVPPVNDSHSTSQSHFVVLTKMITESDTDTKWFGLLHDDTFFPHLEPLSDALGQFDCTKDLYIGALAEDFGSIKNFGLMAFGGAGVFLSATLAKKLGSPEQATACIQESPPNLGDIILRDCVFHHSKAKLTVLPGLYQHDLLNDLRGFYESGVQPLSLHHWKSWYHEPVVEMAAATKFCGNCFLQRWAFGVDTVLSNGYSISIYRSGIGNMDLEKMEKTWSQLYEDTEPQYDFIIGPLREKVGNEERKSFWLKKTEIGDGSMRQLYIHRGDINSGELDEVVELIWAT